MTHDGHTATETRATVPAPRDDTEAASPAGNDRWLDAIIAGWNDTDTWQVCRG